MLTFNVAFVNLAFVDSPYRQRHGRFYDFYARYRIALSSAVQVHMQYFTIFHFSSIHVIVTNSGLFNNVIPCHIMRYQVFSEN